MSIICISRILMYLLGLGAEWILVFRMNDIIWNFIYIFRLSPIAMSFIQIESNFSSPSGESRKKSLLSTTSNLVRTILVVSKIYFLVLLYLHSYEKDFEALL